MKRKSWVEGLSAGLAPRLLRAWSCLLLATFFVPVHSVASERQLDSITVEAKKKREELQTQVDQYVKSAVVHHSGESLMRWDTPVCPLVGGLPRDQGEFILQRLSQAAKNAGAPLAPEQCTANLFVILSSEPDRILGELYKKKPGMFDTRNGVGGLQHFMLTERPIRVWYNSEDKGDAAVGFAIIAAFIGVGGGGATVGGVTGIPSPSAAGADWGVYRMPNSRLTLTVTKSIYTAIVIVDLPRMKNVNVGQLSDYVAMVGLAEINLDKMVVAAPSVLRLFSEPGAAPVDGMSPWDQALLKSLYATRQKSVMQVSEMETQMVDSLVNAQH